MTKILLATIVKHLVDIYIHLHLMKAQLVKNWQNTESDILLTLLIILLNPN